MHSHCWEYLFHMMMMFQVNVLMHTAEVTFTQEQVNKIEALKKKHDEQDQQEIFGNFKKSRAGSSVTASNGRIARSEVKIVAACNDLAGSTGRHESDNGDCESKDIDFSQVKSGELQEETLVQDKSDVDATNSLKAGNKCENLEEAEGGALWDIFRRVDVPKLQEYLKRHFREFRHTHCCPLSQVIAKI